MAVRNGDLSFGFLDLPSWEWYGGFIGKTYGELSAETGLSLELLQVIRQSMGFARPEPEDPVHEEVLDVVPVVKIALEAGADPASIERLVRVWGESMRRISEAAAITARHYTWPRLAEKLVAFYRSLLARSFD